LARLFLFVFAPAQLPVALSTEFITPGPMVELTAIFFIYIQYKQAKYAPVE
jgi:hypothetical protein